MTSFLRFQAAALAISALGAAHAAEPQAGERVRLAGTPQPTAVSADGSEVERTWPTTAEIRIGGQCVESDSWIPNAYVGKRPAKLWGCWGGDNQLFLLENGVLYVGAAKAAHIVPLKADLWPGCETYAISEGARPFEVRACTSRSKTVAPEARVDVVEEGVSTVTVTYARGSKEPARGAPLVAQAIDWRAPAAAIWEYHLGQQLRLTGTSLCLSAAPSGVERGAPLTLEPCAASDEGAVARTTVRLVARPAAPKGGK